MLLAVSVNTYANGSREVNVKKQSTESVEKSPSNWDGIINAIIQVESGGDKNAQHGASLGILQITPVLVQECNKILKKKGSKKKFTLSDRLNVGKSKEMFIIIMEEYNKSKSAIEACRIWNGGVNSKRVRQSYWKKFLEHYKK